MNKLSQFYKELTFSANPASDWPGNYNQPLLRTRSPRRRAAASPSKDCSGKMKINGKKILIFPEYHLTDFPPQAPLTKKEAHELLMAYEKHGFDILISGYVERENNNNFSSCIIIDDGKTHSVRKVRPYKDEVNFISPSTDNKTTIDLSIGKSLFIICHEFSYLLKGEYQDIIAQKDIDNLILISAMFHKHEENTKMCLDYCKEHKIKRFISSDRFFGLNVTEVA